MEDKVDYRQVQDTIVALLKSSGRYVYRRIQNDKDKEAYLDGIKGCIRAVEMCSGDGVEFLISHIKTLNDNSNRVFKPKLFSFSKESYYYSLAFTQAIDIIRSTVSRFITGQRDPDSRFYRNVGINMDDDNDIF